MLPFSFSKARVLSLTSPPPASAGRHFRSSQTENKRHRIKDATTCFSQVVKDRGSSRLPARPQNSRFRPLRRSAPFQVRTGISAGFARKSFAELALRSPARRMLVASRVPVNPSRDFSFRLVLRRFSAVPRRRGSYQATLTLVFHGPLGCGLYIVWRRGDSNP
jgi:hypothetical protein